MVLMADLSFAIFKLSWGAIKRSPLKNSGGRANEHHEVSVRMAPGGKDNPSHPRFSKLGYLRYCSTFSNVLVSAKASYLEIDSVASESGVSLVGVCLHTFAFEMLPT